ncbi:Putative lipid storage droplets surface binding protein 2 [Gryllus bimaculatus]|nr:Putative lipid storage droplets surface binding protein 2 [Gryllus bimaculatus]
MQDQLSASGPRVPPNTPATVSEYSTPGGAPSPRLPLVVLTQPTPAATPQPSPPLPPAPPQPPAPGTQSFSQRVRALPLVASALDAYRSARAGQDALALAVMCSEVAVGVATLPARAVAAPLTALCPWPARAADRLLCLWLDAMETMVPCIKGPPRKMCRPVRICYRTSSGKIRSIPGLIWMSTNDLLSTSCGELLMSSAEKIMLSFDGYVDVILPSPESSDAYWFLRLLSALAHLPTNVARRVYDILRSLMDHVALRAQQAKEAAAAEAEAQEFARRHHSRRLPSIKLFPSE